MIKALCANEVKKGEGEGGGGKGGGEAGRERGQRIRLMLPVLITTAVATVHKAFVL